MTEEGRATAAGHDPGGCLLEARDLVRSYGQTPALRGAGVSVAAGEILAVMGPSGSGKSTLLHCLAGMPGLVSCAQLARIPALGRCQAGAAVAAITVYVGQAGPRSAQAPVLPAASVSPQRLPRLPVETVLVGTNGSAAAINAAWTDLEVAFPYLGPPSPVSGTPGQDVYGELQRLSEVVIVASLVIAGCSLAVSVASGLTDRKRPFSLLRLAGAPLGLLRRVVALESAAPLVVIALLSAGTGFLASQLFLSSELSETLHPPGIAYYVIVFGGLAASLGVIAATFPLLDRITGPEAARNE